MRLRRSAAALGSTSSSLEKQRACSRAASALKTLGAASLALGMAACGSSEAESDQGTISMEEVAKAAKDMPSPVAGQYQSTVELLELDVPGVPDEAKAQMKAAAAKGLAQGNSFCLTKEEAAKGAEQMVQNMANSTCAFERFDVSGRSIDAKMSCSGEGGMQGKVALKGTMSSTQSSMVMDIVQAAPNGQEMTMTMKVDSKRVGDCA